MEEGFYEAAKRCLDLSDPQEKSLAVQRFGAAAEEGNISWDPDYPVCPIGPPGRPERPQLVDPVNVPRRRLGSPEGRAALIHAVAHIEFNAINLALDAAYRFRDMPRRYYSDWLSIAVDEARHFQLLNARLQDLGHAYGDYPAHNGLWQMAEKTSSNCLVRMALVPRVLEARGLDVTPGMIKRLLAAGDAETVVALEVILAEEVRHVAIGTHWFNYCCEKEGLAPLETFLELLERHYSGTIRGPFNLAARYEAGFTEAEMQALTAASSP